MTDTALPPATEAHSALQLAVQFHNDRPWSDEEASLRAALARSPQHANALRSLGLIASGQGFVAEAVLWFRAALEADPTTPQACTDLGIALRQQGMAEESVWYFERAAELAPNDDSLQLMARLSHATRLDEQGRSVEALAAFESVTQHHPDSADAWAALGQVQRFLNQLDSAAASFQRALQIEPDRLELIDLFAKTLRELRRYGDATVVLDHLLRLDPERSELPGRLMHNKLDAADWTALDQLNQQIEAATTEGALAAEPFTLLANSNSPELQLRCARQHAARIAAPNEQHLPRPVLGSGERLRIGYVAGEFRHHALAILLTGVLEHHDRSQFEVIAFDTAGGDDSLLRRRIEAAVDVVSLRGLGTAAAMDVVRSRHIDILVDLNGYSGAARHDLFKARCAPIQVNYLGYPGTTGLDAIDYIVADRIVIPPSAHAHYSEQVVYLPECYQPNDTQRVIATEPSRRSQIGMRDDAFVFCCMNHVFKVLPAMFDIWMRLLQQVPGSVLMLYSNHPETQDNLRQEASARGVEPDRLIFGGPMGTGNHLARLRLCDLFLDSWPCNAHTSGSDALWAGVPVLSCTGDTFASRVGASLLHAVGLPELATESFEDYEAMALRLATEPALLATMRQRLAANLASAPLFDIVRYTRQLEAAFSHMAEQARNNRAPAPFALDPQPYPAT